MEIITTKDMTEYLRQVVALEGSVYRQQQALRSAEEDLKLQLPKKPSLPAPVNEAKKITMEDVEKMPEFQPVQIDKKYYVQLVVCCLVALYFLFIFLMNGIKWDGVIFVCVLTPIIMALLLRLKIAVIRNENEQKEVKTITYFEKAQKEYEKEKTRYSEEMAEYEVECRNYELESEKAKKAYSIAEEAVDKLRSPLADSHQLLRQLYGLNLIFPKYRNLTAMCSIYEYFASGRCSVLEGPEGAYNLYEAELRQNLIINQLEGISQKLDQIQKNQYTLYREVWSIKYITDSIASDVRGILRNTQAIAENSYITALNTEAIAKNTEAIKYISLING